MKLSLRNLALAGALTVAGAAMAQDAPFTVTQKWAHVKNTELKNVYGGPKFGCGVNGKVYTDDADGKLVVIDQNGITRKDVAWAATNTSTVSVGADDAGNLLLNANWPAAGTSTNFCIIDTEGNEHPLTITLPDGVDADRFEQIGRIAGDMMSEEGAFFYITIYQANTIVCVKIANGEQVVDAFDFANTETSPVGAITTSTLAHPFYTAEELNDMGEDAVNGFVLRNRTTQEIWYYDFAEGQYAKMTKPAGANSPEGFDVFILGDKTYQVQPIKVSANYEPAFVIADEDGNIVYTQTYDYMGNAGQSLGAINARKVSDTKVELYQYFVNSEAAIIAMYEIELPVAEPDPLYIVGLTGWDFANPDEFTYADGKYTYLYNGSGKFKISTVKGADWVAFNTGVIGVAEDNTTYTLTAGQEETLVAGKIGDFQLPGKGEWTITVSGDLKTLVLTGKAEEVFAPEKVYVRGTMNGWGLDEAWTLKLDTDNRGANNEYIYKGQFDTLHGEFKIADENWGDINYGRRDYNNPGVTHNDSEEHSVYEMWHNCDGFTADNLKNVGMEFHWNPDKTNTSYLRLYSTSGVDSIVAAEENDAVYYNLNGVKVDNMTPGVYVKVAAGKASKVVVK